MRRFSIIVLGSGAFGLLVLSVIGFAGSLFWMFDLCNSFRPQYLILSLGGLGLSLISPSRILVGCFVGTLFLNLSLIAPLFISPSDSSEQDNPSRELSVMSYNVWVRNNDWSAIKLILDAESSAMIYLTEVNPDIGARLESLKNDFHVFRANSDAILVRRDARLNPRLLTNDKVESLPGLVISFEIEDVKLMLLGIHPAAPLSGESALMRDESFDEIASFAESRDEMVIVVGDFNSTSWGSSFRKLQKRTGLVNSQRGFGLQTTWPSYPESNFNWLLRAPIDHCLHSTEIVTLDRVVGNAGKSNHNPIRVTLRVPVSR